MEIANVYKRMCRSLLFAWPMTLHQLRIFLSVAKYLNVSRAASELRVSQPSVSQGLRSLEEEFEVKLHVKTNQGIRLTDTGIRFLKRIEPIMFGVDELHADFKLNQEPQAPQPFLLGAGHSAADSWLPSLLTAFQKTQPDLKTVLYTDWSPNVEESVAKGEWAMGVVLRPSYRPELTYETFGKEGFVFVVARSHPLANRRRIDLAELETETFVSVEGGLIGAILSSLEEQDFTPNVVMRCEAPASVRSAVRAGIGIGILMENVLEPWNNDLKVLKVPQLDDAAGFDTCVVYPKDAELSEPAAQFLDLIRAWSRGELDVRQRANTTMVQLARSTAAPKVAALRSSERTRPRS